MTDWLALRAQASPDHPALIYHDQVWTYAALNQMAAEYACRLNEAGLDRGDRIAVLLPNSPAYVTLIHALARLGAVLVPLNNRLTSYELRARITQAGCVALIYDSKDTPRNISLIDPAWISLSLDELAALPASGADRWTSRPLDQNAVQGLVFTSGTTGNPKGALLTFANHLWSAQASARRLGNQPDDRWLACMPLVHVGGQSIVLRCCLYGTTMVLHDGFDVAVVSDALDGGEITLVSLVPTMLRRLLEHRGERSFPAAVRCVLLGGAAAPATLVERCITLNIPVALTYGLTEAASQVATVAPDQVREKPGSVGQPLIYTGLRIASPAGEALPAGEIGEILVSGPTVMRGYDNDPEANERALENGWLHTGDLGYQDSDGDLWIVQRRADLIITGGENVYPAEVEAVLLRHPLINEACVVGLPDEEWGQRVSALLVVKGPVTEGEVIAHCREHLAGFKVPRHLRMVDHLPQTESGKVSRRGVLAMFAADEVIPER